MSYLGDGLDAVDRIQVQSYKERKARENIHTLKLREKVQTDEHTKINNYSEGYCYSCNKIDKVLSTLVYYCGECIENRGVEGLMQMLVKKNNWELCDKHEGWVFADVWQINCSLCDTCMRRLKLLHKAYRKAGGRTKAPDEVRKRKIYGKEFNEILGTGISRDQTRDQIYARR